LKAELVGWFIVSPILSGAIVTAVLDQINRAQPYSNLDAGPSLNAVLAYGLTW